jgi:4-oxalocrotonate tautomerase
MPIITVDLFEGRSRQQREAFAKAVTQACVEILKAPLDHTWVVFREHAKSHWAMAGRLCDEEG